jgi:hypothetical protein
MGAATLFQRKPTATMDGAAVHKPVHLDDDAWPEILHDGEHVKSVVYGRRRDGSAMLIATAERIIYLYRKGSQVLMDEIAYDEVFGVGSELEGRDATVRLLTPETEYVIAGANEYNAEDFVEFVEEWQLSREIAKRYFVIFGERPAIRHERTEATRAKSVRILGDRKLSGYYWMPSRDNVCVGSG